MRTRLIRCVWLLTGVARLFAAPQPSAAPLPFVSPIFGDHMVLKRGKPNAIWGWSTPGDKVRIELAERSGQQQTVEWTDVLVGDVWICAGQSNTQFGLGQADLHIAIGLVHEAVGGVPAETFTSPEALRPLKDFDDGIAEVEGRRQKSDPEYGNYIMHWLDEYDIGAKTTSWADPALDDSSWAEMREAQALTAMNVPHSCLAVTIDTGNPDNIHLKVLWIGCGTEDPGYNGVKGMDELLSKKGVKHVWNESGGGHSWPNWQVYLSKYAPLLFHD